VATFSHNKCPYFTIYLYLQRTTWIVHYYSILHINSSKTACNSSLSSLILSTSVWRMVSRNWENGLPDFLLEEASCPSFISTHGKILYNLYIIRNNSLQLAQRISLPSLQYQCQRPPKEWSPEASKSTNPIGLFCFFCNGYFYTHNRLIWCPSNKGTSPSINSTLVQDEE